MIYGILALAVFVGLYFAFFKSNPAQPVIVPPAAPVTVTSLYPNAASALQLSLQATYSNFQSIATTNNVLADATVTSGLPAGMSVTTVGAAAGLVGTPTDLGDYSFNVQVTDGVTSATATVFVSVVPPAPSNS